MKHYLNIKKVITRFCLLTVFTAGITATQAQTFVPPAAYEDSYPPAGNPNISRTRHTSCYSFDNIGFGGFNADLVISGWDEPNLNSGVAWRMLSPGTPSVIINQGILPYSNVQDIEVGFVNTTQGIQAVVAYYKVGSGHFVDVYNWGAGGVSPVPLYTLPLSGMTSYTRISIDCHKLYGVAITWQEKYIKTIVGLGTAGGINWSGILDIGGSYANEAPDCAFSHTQQAGTLNVHYAYYDPASSTVTESSYDFWIMIGMLSGTVPVAVNDLNPVTFTNVSRLNLDCPDHYDVENWAYTYTLDAKNIDVRLIDYHTTATPTTVTVNSGILGNAAINLPINYHPFLAYDHDCILGVGSMYVGWYTSVVDPATTTAAAYVSLQMDESGTTLLTPVDYMTVANNPFMASGTPVMSFSKQNDATNFLYTIFPQYWNPWGGYMMQNKYHPWNTAAFKGEKHVVMTCNDEEKIKTFTNKHIATTHITAYPNPFSTMLGLSIPNENQNDDATISVTDITGKGYGNYNGKLINANSYLTTLSKTLVPGQYTININIDGKSAQSLKITKTE